MSYRVFFGDIEVSELVQGITVEDSLGELAVRASVELVVPPDLRITLGGTARISGIPTGRADYAYLLGSQAHPAVLWTSESERLVSKTATVTLYDRLIYLAKCEDEYLMQAKTTATARLRRYAGTWGIPLGTLEETGQPLEQAVYRDKSIAAMIQDDLRETARKSGRLYAVRMLPSGLGLIRIGRAAAWSLDGITEKEQQSRSLEDAVTRVKVLGEAGDDKRSPLKGVYDQDIARYGTLQRISRARKQASASTIRTDALAMLAGPEETLTLPCAVSINTLRAGDSVQYRGVDYIVCRVRHEWGTADKMTVTLGSLSYVHRQFYQ